MGPRALRLNIIRYTVTYTVLRSSSAFVFNSHFSIDLIIYSSIQQIFSHLLNLQVCKCFDRRPHKVISFESARAAPFGLEMHARKSLFQQFAAGRNVQNMERSKMGFHRFALLGKGKKRTSRARPAHKNVAGGGEQDNC